MLLLGVAAMSLSAYDKAQAEADAELIRIYEEENRIFKDLNWHQEGTRGQYITFWTLQVLDVYSTYRGLKYDCVREINPILGPDPSVAQMVTHKTIFLNPFYILPGEGVITKDDMVWVNTMMSTVVYNNYRVWDRAHKRCTRK
jgi:hypothetical protein